jgi:predicted phosphodiesterase
MSDIHGDYEHFENLLEIIKFQDKDKLYILGDVINKNSYKNVRLLYEA